MIFVNNRPERRAGTDGATNIATNAGVCYRYYMMACVNIIIIIVCLFWSYKGEDMISATGLRAWRIMYRLKSKYFCISEDQHLYFCNNERVACRVLTMKALARKDGRIFWITRKSKSLLKFQNLMSARNNIVVSAFALLFNNLSWQKERRYGTVYLIVNPELVSWWKGGVSNLIICIDRPRDLLLLILSTFIEGSTDDKMIKISPH